MHHSTPPIFQDEDAARKHLEELRWPNGPVCPHCREMEHIKALQGKSHRPGLYKCYTCRRHFSVTVGTAFERSKVPLRKWLLAAHLMATSDKPVSAHQIHKAIGVTYKTAWHMMKRLREATNQAATAPAEGGSTDRSNQDDIQGGGRKDHKHQVRGASTGNVLRIMGPKRSH
jgi:transposase-like protein